MKQSITDINSGDIQRAVSQLKMVNQLLRGNEQGMLMIIGKIQYLKQVKVDFGILLHDCCAKQKQHIITLDIFIYSMVD